MAGQRVVRVEVEAGDGREGLLNKLAGALVLGGATIRPGTYVLTRLPAARQEQDDEEDEQ